MTTCCSPLSKCDFDKYNFIHKALSERNPSGLGSNGFSLQYVEFKMEYNMRGGRGPSWSGSATCQYILTEVLDSLLNSLLAERIVEL